MKDYYGLLGVDGRATKSDIKKNYRKLVTKFHPDKNSAPDAATKFIAITEAYEVLSDKKRRAQYDLSRWESKKQKQAAEYDYDIVKAPQESLRTRRRKAQQKRGTLFQQTALSNQQTQIQILKESFIISGRYIFHSLGIMLLVVILYSAINQIKDSFDISVGVGIGLCLFVVALVYYIYRLGQLTYEDLTQDMNTFSVLFGLSSQTVLASTVFAFVGMTVLIVLALMALLT